ncbi:MAG: hypothetical protein IH892_19035 [Planctomycetes bacterium]|nr:hypothetical protein [Planctomycetota bacterium]
MRFPVPPAAHGTPPSWVDQSDNPAWWPEGDLFNGGVHGGYYASIAGPAKNLRLPDDVSPYLFE